MAKMDENQEALLSKLVNARVAYDKFETLLANYVSDAKWEKKKLIRDLVREARKAGVPYRQIGIALETSDHQTLKNYEKDIRR